MVLKNVSDIKKPTKNFTLVNNKEDLEIQVIDYYRCLDTLDINNDDDNGNGNGNGGNGEEENADDIDDDNLFSKEKQKELSYKQPMLVKAYGVLDSGHSITVNLHNFQPFFYIKIPDTWDRKQCSILISSLRKAVYYKYKDHLLKTQIVIRKPFREFTGNDKFKFLKLQFKNKEAFDQFAFKLSKPLKVDGICDSKPYKYDLYESNMEPIIKLIHLTKINPAGWIKIPKAKYKVLKERTTHTNFEISLEWDQIQPLEKIATAPINEGAFDIEADSSHGDFPVAAKNYQKLAQDLITVFNELGVTTKRNKMHRLFQNAPKKVLETLLHLVFDDNYNNNLIHQIATDKNLKPHPDTVDQISYTISQSFQQCLTKDLTNDEFLDLMVDLFERNLPAIDYSLDDNSHYGLLAKEMMMQMFILNKANNKRFKEDPCAVIALMINLAFNEYYDAFNVNCIYTKHNIKPDKNVIDALIPDILVILKNCAQFVNFKKLPEPDTFKTSDETIYNKDNMSQDGFVKLLTDLLNKYLPSVEGDKLIQIGTTFRLVGQADCYLKHIICLGTCDDITNDEMITLENKDIYLPVDDLAKDLIMYEKQLGQHQDLSKEQLDKIIKDKCKEIKTWDVKFRKLQCQKAAEFRRIKQSMTDKSKVIVECYDNEKDILLAWKELIIKNDPDVLLGYNIFNFDFKFLAERAIELNCSEEFCQLGRLKDFSEGLFEQKLSSAGLGDNTLRYIPMNGRVIVDLYKVIQKDHRLDSYKLDRVCHKFLYKEKVDMPPQDIFILQKGSSTDRKKIAAYCLVDCILCNKLGAKLEIIGNNIAMANVCKVPFPYLFLRGQGVKIFSLVADVCSKEGFLIPVLPKADITTDDKYEGAIVLQPFTGIYFDPIAVADFNSLYPSSMISENLSHDSFTEIGGKYDNLKGYTYVNIEYDTYKITTAPGKKKKIKQKIGVETCRYAQLPDGKKSILPSILMNLLASRKSAKKKMDAEKDPFKAKIWNGLQLAFKTTANSLYGQCGAKTSPIYKKQIAASTTAIGRSMILFSKKHVETKYKDIRLNLGLYETCLIEEKNGEKVEIPTKYTGLNIHVKNTYCVYGDTDSIFIKFTSYWNHDPDQTLFPGAKKGEKIDGIDAIFVSMALCKLAAKEISSQLKKPQNLDFEKVIMPFILISKKRYHGHYYTKMCDTSFSPKSMGIVLSRRDNAEILKYVFGGALDIIMHEKNIEKARDFVKNECAKILKGGFPLEKFIMSKTLKSYYKKPKQIAHNVLANRQAQRDPGNRFAPNDRVPYAFIVHPNPSKDHLQGDMIETPEYINQAKLKVNYKKYITNQIMKPVSQIFDLVPGFENCEKMFENLVENYENDMRGAVRMDHFFKIKPAKTNITKLFDLIEQARITKENLAKQDVVLDDDDEKFNYIKENELGDDIDGNDDGEPTSNYDDPNF